MNRSDITIHAISWNIEDLDFEDLIRHLKITSEHGQYKTYDPNSFFTYFTYRNLQLEHDAECAEILYGLGYQMGLNG